MNITPIPLSSHLPATDRERPVEAVRPANRSRDALQGDGRDRTPPRQPVPVDAEALLTARAGVGVQPYTPGLSVRANRALASYAEVAGTPQRSRLEALLGFDDYA